MCGRRSDLRFWLGKVVLVAVAQHHHR
jgi:hypothetical protein